MCVGQHYAHNKLRPSVVESDDKHYLKKYQWSRVVVLAAKKSSDNQSSWYIIHNTQFYL